MLIPLPPASVSPWLARWRCPRWKFGTVSVRSIAAFMVTVTIRRTTPPCGPGYASRTSSRGRRGRAGRPSGPRRAGPADQAPALEDENVAERLAPAHGEPDLGRGDHPLTSGRSTRTVGMSDLDATSSSGFAPVAEPRLRVPAAGLDHRGRTVAREAPVEQLHEVGVARIRGRGCRAASRRSSRRACAPRPPATSPRPKCGRS